jgi:hypothetical protein
MDERDRDARLSATFQDAAQDAPPAEFDVAEVLATSRRLTRRRRSALAGAALAVLALAGVGATAELAGGSETAVASSAHSRNGADAAAEPDGRDADRAAGLEAQAAPAPQAAPHGAVEGESPLGPGMRECADRQDPQLRALVEQVLPEVEGAPEAPTTRECRPGGERGLALEVRDGDRSGVLTVTYLPPGASSDPASGARSARTASGGTLVVSSRSEEAGDPPPFADRLDKVAAYLALRL